MNSAHCKRDQNELLKNIYRSAQKYRPNKNNDIWRIFCKRRMWQMWWDKLRPKNQNKFCHSSVTEETNKKKKDFRNLIQTSNLAPKWAGCELETSSSATAPGTSLSSSPTYRFLEQKSCFLLNIFNGHHTMLQLSIQIYKC